MLGDSLLPTNSSIRNWASGQGHWIADSLGQALLLPDDMQYFSEGSDDVISFRLKWHTIAVNLDLFFFPPLFLKLFMYSFHSSF